MLIEYLPPVISRMKEMQAIMSAEQPEFDLLEKEIDQILANMFILLADETGIARFEAVLGITPGATEQLEDRRLSVLSRANKSKVTTKLITGIISNYAPTELIKDFDNDELTIALKGDAGSLQIIYDILDEKIPLNVYYDFLLKRSYEVGIKIGSKIYELYDRAAGDQEHCGNENQITSITETAYNITIGGFCNIAPPIVSGQAICGAGFGEIQTEPVYTAGAVNVELSQTYSAGNTPFIMSGEEYAGKEI